MEEGDEAIAAGANIIMLDNLVGDELHSAAKQLKEKWAGKREFLIETSGGIVEDSLTSRIGPGELPSAIDIMILLTSRYRHSVHVCGPPELPTCRLFAQDPAKEEVTDMHVIT